MAKKLPANIQTVSVNQSQGSRSTSVTRHDVESVITMGDLAKTLPAISVIQSQAQGKIDESNQPNLRRDVESVITMGNLAKQLPANIIIVRIREAIESTRKDRRVKPTKLQI